jgi:sec-independent protein translocase protein TatB
MPSSFELIIIAVVALIVIGPERLPKVARTAGLLLARLQRYVNDVKADINREMQLEELKKLQQQVAEQTRGIEQSVSAELTAVNEHLKSLETTVNETLAKTGVGAESAPAAAPDAAPAVPPPVAPAVAPPSAAPSELPADKPKT